MDIVQPPPDAEKGDGLLMGMVTRQLLIEPAKFRLLALEKEQSRLRRRGR